MGEAQWDSTKTPTRLRFFWDLVTLLDVGKLSKGSNKKIQLAVKIIKLVSWFLSFWKRMMSPTSASFWRRWLPGFLLKLLQTTLLKDFKLVKKTRGTPTIAEPALTLWYEAHTFFQQRRRPQRRNLMQKLVGDSPDFGHHDFQVIYLSGGGSVWQSSLLFLASEELGKARCWDCWQWKNADENCGSTSDENEPKWLWMIDSFHQFVFVENFWGALSHSQFSQDSWTPGPESICTV